LEKSLKKIREKNERAGLRAVVKNGEVLPAQSLPDERRDDTAIAYAHSRAVSVKDPHNFRVDPVEAVISHGHCLGETLGLIVNAARPDRVDVAPVIFLFG